MIAAVQGEKVRTAPPLTPLPHFDVFNEVGPIVQLHKAALAPLIIR
jgi:hypothetical protein